MRRPFLLIGLLTLFATAAPAQPAPPRPLAFTHVNVVDVSRGGLTRDVTVLIEAGTVTAVASAAQARVPAGAEVVDGSGKFLIPGLWDMHVHWYDERLLPLFVANGVTGVRQMWGMGMHFDWRARARAGTLVAPHLAIASTIVDGPNPVWPESIVVGTDAEARRAVRKIKDDGFDFVKVYEQLPRDAYFAIADEAKKLGLPFAGHVPLSIRAAEASEAGQRSIEHLSAAITDASAAGDAVARRAALLQALGGKTADAATRRQLRELGDRILAAYDEKQASALFATFVRNGTWQCPTLVVLRAMASLDDPAFVSDPRLKYMPPSIRESWVPKRDFRLSTKGPEDYALDRRLFKKRLEVVGAMHRAGVKLLAGTDVLNPFAFPGFSLHDELGLLVQAGLTPLDALRTATVNAATYLDQRAMRGTIEPGQAADLVLLDADPLADIANTKRIASVVLGGRLFRRADLDAMLSGAEHVASLKSLAGVLEPTLTARGIAAAIEQYRDLKRRQPGAYDFSEDALNAFGYRLLGEKKVDEAIAVLTLATESYPRSSNAFDSLAEAYMTKGDRAHAIENYKRALQLDPKNSNAAAKLKELGGA